MGSVQSAAREPNAPKDTSRMQTGARVGTRWWDGGNKQQCWQQRRWRKWDRRDAKTTAAREAAVVWIYFLGLLCCCEFQFQYFHIAAMRRIMERKKSAHEAKRRTSQRKAVPANVRRTNSRISNSGLNWAVTISASVPPNYSWRHQSENIYWLRGSSECAVNWHYV